jgi:hypothetical protein
MITVDGLEQELYLKVAGYTTAIEIYPRETERGLDYGPVLVEVVVLDPDGRTIAYRLSTDDEQWEVGGIADAVAEAEAYREQAEADREYLRAAAAWRPDLPC